MATGKKRNEHHLPKGMELMELTLTDADEVYLHHQLTPQYEAIQPTLDLITERLSALATEFGLRTLLASFALPATAETLAKEKIVLPMHGTYIWETTKIELAMASTVLMERLDVVLGDPDEPRQENLRTTIFNSANNATA